MKLTKVQRDELKCKFNGLCAYCGTPLGELWHADHLLPVIRVEASSMEDPHRDCLENMMPACAPCNIDKSRRPLEDWRQKLTRACEVLRRNQPTYRHALRFGLVQEKCVPITFYFERINQSSRSTGSKTLGLNE